MSLQHHIQVFEHCRLVVGEAYLDAQTKKTFVFREPHRLALERYYGDGTPFFRLIHRGVQFNEHVGVLQAGSLTIEVLPKADNSYEDANDWQQFLVTMLQSAGIFPKVTSTASLRLKAHSILDLYMQLFLQEVTYLIQTGLVRKYRKTEGNATALKGSLLFAQNIRHNLTHAERFYVRHTVYDRNNRFNAVLREAVLLVRSISNSSSTRGRASALELDLPECDAVRISETLFAKLPFDRKTEAYRPAISMARLLLLRYHPDVRRGGEEVLALMFDMNLLWERYVARQLRRKLQEKGLLQYQVREQVRNEFWQPERGYVRTVRPDIVVCNEKEDTVLVLDTKWKRLRSHRPDDADLKQMLIYNLYNGCTDSALVYPAVPGLGNTKGTYRMQAHGSCRLAFMPLTRNTKSGMAVDVSDLVALIQSCDENFRREQGL